MAKLTEVVKKFETKKGVTKEEIKKFFESLPYEKAVVDTDRCSVRVKFNADVIKLEDYPFPTEEESNEILKYMGISDLITSYSKNGEEYFRTFEFIVDKNAMNERWYKKLMI